MRRPCWLILVAVSIAITMDPPVLKNETLQHETNNRLSLSPGVRGDAFVIVRCVFLSPWLRRRPPLPLFAAAVNPGRLLGRGLEDGPEDGDAAARGRRLRGEGCPTDEEVSAEHLRQPRGPALWHAGTS
jgi:hypothetical protein